MARTWRVHHPDLPRLAGAVVDLVDDEAHHVRRVLRLEPGETLALFDGAGSEWSAVIEKSDPRGVRVRLVRPVEAAVEPQLCLLLYQALCQPERMDWLVQKATEVGVAEIRPFVARRSGRPGIAEQRLARWRRVAVEAAKQSGRRVVPPIDPALDLPPTAHGLALLLDPRPEVPPLDRACAGIDRPAIVALAVGPEGGFEDDEVQAWTAAGWRPAGLGPRTLRADTAGIVAAAILLHRWADLGAAAPATGRVDSGQRDT